MSFKSLSHLQTKRVVKDIFFFNLVVLALGYALCLLLQILFVAALDIKIRDAPTLSSVNSLLSQYRKASHFFLQIFMYWGVGGNCLLCPGCPMGKGQPCSSYYQSLGHKFSRGFCARKY
jgi:hypothetical protein